MNHQMHNLFPVPVYQSRISPPDKITLIKLTSFEWEDPGYDGPVTHKESANRKVLDLPQLKKIKDELQQHIDYYVYKILGVSREQRWEITTSWINQAVPKQYHSMHIHSNSMISGTYYVKTNPKSGTICFHRSAAQQNLWGSTLCIEFDKTTEYNVEAVGFNPEPGDILLFPSILSHSVLSNESDEDRYSLAFNVFPRGTFGQGGNSELEI